jgi:hypothetical protein
MKSMKDMKGDFTELSNQMIGCAIEVHKALGPGLLETITPLHEAQLLTYMKLANIRHGFLINFNVKLLKQGLKSFVL